MFFKIRTELLLNKRIQFVAVYLFFNLDKMKFNVNNFIKTVPINVIYIN